jgi:phosphoribosyl-AMP cyclohydrolase / phosphoribosyl-ATP pyrophosphohydrolase
MRDEPDGQHRTSGMSRHGGEPRAQDQERHMSDVTFLETLESVIRQRVAAAPEGSYTARLAAEGVLKVAQKVGEEAVELAIAAAVQDRAHVMAEAADLMYHFLLLLKLRDLTLADVVAELEGRHRPT